MKGKKDKENCKSDECTIQPRKKIKTDRARKPHKQKNNSGCGNNQLDFDLAFLDNNKKSDMKCTRHKRVKKNPSKDSKYIEQMNNKELDDLIEEEKSMAERKCKAFYNNSNPKPKIKSSRSIGKDNNISEYNSERKQNTLNRHKPEVSRRKKRSKSSKPVCCSSPDSIIKADFTGTGFELGFGDTFHSYPTIDEQKRIKDVTKRLSLGYRRESKSERDKDSRHQKKSKHKRAVEFDLSNLKPRDFYLPEENTTCGDDLRSIIKKPSVKYTASSSSIKKLNKILTKNNRCLIDCLSDLSLESLSDDNSNDNKYPTLDKEILLSLAESSKRSKSKPKVLKIMKDVLNNVEKQTQLLNILLKNTGIDINDYKSLCENDKFILSELKNKIALYQNKSDDNQSLLKRSILDPGSWINSNKVTSPNKDIATESSLYAILKSEKSTKSPNNVKWGNVQMVPNDDVEDPTSNCSAINIAEVNVSIERASPEYSEPEAFPSATCNTPLDDLLSQRPTSSKLLRKSSIQEKLYQNKPLTHPKHASEKSDARSHEISGEPLFQQDYTVVPRKHKFVRSIPLTRPSIEETKPRKFMRMPLYASPREQYRIYKHTKPNKTYLRDLLFK